MIEEKAMLGHLEVDMDFYILADQTLLVKDLLNDGCYESIEGAYSKIDPKSVNIPRSDEFKPYINGKEDIFPAIKQWVLISRKLGKFLTQQDEIVIDCDYGTWWGRFSDIPIEKEKALSNTVFAVIKEPLI